MHLDDLTFTFDADVLKVQVMGEFFSLKHKLLSCFSLGTILLGSNSVCRMLMGLLPPGTPKYLKPSVSARPRSAFLFRDETPKIKNGRWNFEFDAQITYRD
jgi:hypothetical protein